MAVNRQWIGVGLVGWGLLVGSMGLNVLLFHQAQKYYLELNLTRLDPIGLQYYPNTPQAASELQAVRVVFVGDSRAAGWPAPTLPGYEFINRGISSQTSIQVLQRLSSHVYPLKPDVVVIQVGVNDLKTIGLFPENRQAIVADCKAHIQRMVDASRQTGAVVVITTIFPAGAVPLQRRPFWSDQINQAIQEVNAYITTLANEQTLVLDAFSHLADPRGLLVSRYRADELHLNQAGYAVLNQALVLRLKTIQGQSTR